MGLNSRHWRLTHVRMPLPVHKQAERERVDNPREHPASWPYGKCPQIGGEDLGLVGERGCPQCLSHCLLHCLPHSLTLFCFCYGLKGVMLTTLFTMMFTILFTTLSTTLSPTPVPSPSHACPRPSTPVKHAGARPWHSWPSLFRRTPSGRGFRFESLYGLGGTRVPPSQVS